jgi:hypothetical protein
MARGKQSIPCRRNYCILWELSHPIVSLSSSRSLSTTNQVAHHPVGYPNQLSVFHPNVPSKQPHNP